MEEDRKCQEQYEEEMRKLEEERKAEQEPQEPHEVTPQQTLRKEITCETTKIGGEAVEALVEKVLNNVPLPQDQETEKTRKGGYTQTSELTAENIYDTVLKTHNAAGPNYKSPQEARLAKRAPGDKNSNENNNQKRVVSCGTEEDDGKLEATASVETVIDTDLQVFSEERFSDKPQRDTPPSHLNESMKPNRSSPPQDILVGCGKCGDKFAKATGEEDQRMSSAKGPLQTKENDLHHINAELNPKCDTELLGNASETKCPVNCSEDALHALTHNGEVEGDEQVGKADVAASPSHFDHQKPQEGFGGSELHTNKARGREEDNEVQRADAGEPGLETLQLPEPYKGRMGAGSRLMVEVCRLGRPISVNYFR